MCGGAYKIGSFRISSVTLIFFSLGGSYTRMETIGIWASLSEYHEGSWEVIGAQ